MTFAGGKIVLALEGGYNLTSIANSALACMEVLLDDKAVEGSAEVYPFESTWRVIQAVSSLNYFWKSNRRYKSVFGAVVAELIKLFLGRFARN